ncbi:hypothetical protein LV28_15610 [Pandoraea pnomenusa]|nr:hypothetical protein U875_22390 [Pandoraea pnomenusa 3kgm]AHN77509.1 hypothetical protein DA70_15070 [Pandoraea pnomenusa]AIU27779.1 hypothetical protein LV28_15610 [Pandoraea pnomenusa]
MAQLGECSAAHGHAARRLPDHSFVVRDTATTSHAAQLGVTQHRVTCDSPPRTCRTRLTHAMPRFPTLLATPDQNVC